MVQLVGGIQKEHRIGTRMVLRIAGGPARRWEGEGGRLGLACRRGVRGAGGGGGGGGVGGRVGETRRRGSVGRAVAPAAAAVVGG